MEWNRQQRRYILDEVDRGLLRTEDKYPQPATQLPRLQKLAHAALDRAALLDEFYLGQPSHMDRLNAIINAEDHLSELD